LKLNYSFWLDACSLRKCFLRLSLSACGIADEVYPDLVEESPTYRVLHFTQQKVIIPFMISFEHIEFTLGLIVLIPLVLIFVFVLRWKRQVKKALGDEHLINQLTKNYSARLYTIKFVAVLLALAMCVIAAVNLRKSVNGGKEPTAGIDVMIALDVSKSMLSTDIKPSRLERAKQLVSILIDRLENNRVGLIIFAGHAYLQMPLTPDLEEAKMYLSNASPDAVPVQGTNIGEALELSDNSLDTKEKTHKAVILITDGEDHDPNADKIAQHVADDGVIVYAVGIGTAEGSPITEPGTGTYKTDIEGKTIISKLNEAELKNIAVKTNGNYFHLDNALATANQVTNALSGIEKKLITGSGEREYFSFAPFFIGFAVLLLVLEIFIPETLKEKRNKQQKKVVTSGEQV
jgi:Ca-activated chloride channel family protein